MGQLLFVGNVEGGLNFNFGFGAAHWLKIKSGFGRGVERNRSQQALGLHTITRVQVLHEQLANGFRAGIGVGKFGFLNRWGNLSLGRRNGNGCCHFFFGRSGFLWRSCFCLRNLDRRGITTSQRQRGNCNGGQAKK